MTTDGVYYKKCIFLKSICTICILLTSLDAISPGSRLVPVETRLQGNSGSAPREDSEFTGVNSCHWREFDLCSVGTASLFQNPNGLPQSELELKRQCEYLNESVKCFEDFANKCLTGHQFQLFELFSASALGVVRDFCRSNSELRQNYTKHVQCFREVQLKHQRSCVTDFQVGFESIHKINHGIRLQTACCNLNRLRECMLGPVEYECGLAATETIRQLVESMVAGLLELPCREHDPFGEKCTSLLPKIGTRPHGGRNTSALSKIIAGFTNVPAQQG